MEILNRRKRYDIFNPPPGLKIIIPKITPDKARGMWDVVEGLIQDYTKLHPEEMRLVLESNKYIRSTRRNRLASSKSGSMRWGMSIPAGLDILIRKYYPEVLSEKKRYHQFMRKFPGFRICEVV